MDKQVEDTRHLGVHEQRWTVEGIEIAGVVSGPQDGVPMLALHGWLDNAASFDALRQQLSDVRLIAIDLPGHGLSAHRSADAGYQIFDDLPQLVGLIEELGHERVILLGHSRGAMIATLLAASLPERISALITLDGMVPLPAEDAAFAKNLTAFLRERIRQAARQPRIFASIDDFAARRARTGEPEHIARQLASRALLNTDDGYAWRGDYRLSGASAIKLNRGQIEAMLGALTVPVLNIWATPSERMKTFSQSAQKLAADCIRDLTTEHVDGHHHCHMEDPYAREIAQRISTFIRNR